VLDVLDIESDQLGPSESLFGIDEIKHRRAVLTDLDDAWVLMQLKAIARNGVALGECIDRFAREENGDPRVLQSTMIKLRAIAGVVQANELLGKYLGMWKDEAGQSNRRRAAGDRGLLEGLASGDAARTKRSEDALTAALFQRGPRKSRHPGHSHAAYRRNRAGDIHHLEDRGPSLAPDVKNPAGRKWYK
jgi:hypothetical protein